MLARLTGVFVKVKSVDAVPLDGPADQAPQGLELRLPGRQEQPGALARGEDLIEPSRDHRRAEITRRRGSAADHDTHGLLPSPTQSGTGPKAGGSVQRKTPRRQAWQPGMIPW